MSKSTWRLKKGTTWRDKLRRGHPNHGTVVDASPAQQKRGGRRLLIPRPLDVDAAIRRVRKGRLISMDQLRAELTRGTDADTSCPMTTGIFVRIVAEAAEEDRRAGRKRITPYWRVVQNDGGLNPKFPGGATAQARHLRREGFTITRAKGKQPPKVKDFESSQPRL